MSRKRSRQRTRRLGLELLESRCVPASTADLLNATYSDLLFRPVDQAGLNNFGGALASGASRTDVARGIVSSAEFRGQAIDGLYGQFLNRGADAGGLQGYLDSLANGGRLGQVAAAIAGSPEYFNRTGGSNGAFLDALFRDALGRAPDDSALASFGQSLDAGTRTPGQVAEAVLSSDEWYRNMVRSYYDYFLFREPDQASLDNFVKSLQAGTREEDVLATFVASTEYESVTDSFEKREITVPEFAPRLSRQQDADQDGLEDLSEPGLGTDPTRFDTDGDLLPDGFEEEAEGLDPLAADPTTGDLDADTLNNIQEVINRTRPDFSDTDGDGVSDGQEARQGSNPIDPGDAGQAPPDSELVEVTLTVGDHSGSHSERYDLIVGPFVHQAPEFGVVETATYKLRRNQVYRVEVVHRGSNLDSPDFDYTAQIGAASGSVFVQDPEGILGVHDESDPFFAAGKSAILVTADPATIDGLQGEPPQDERGFIDYLQDGLGLIGVFDPTPIADSINTVLYVFRGQDEAAAISVLGIVPYLGDVAKVGKYSVKFGANAVGAADEIADARRTVDFVSTPDGLIDIRSSVQRIEGKQPLPFKHQNDGSIYQNDPLKFQRPGQPLGQKLPNQPLGYYTEHTVITPGLNKPGAQRIIRGNNGEYFYSPNHYQTFVPLNDAARGAILP